MSSTSSREQEVAEAFSAIAPTYDDHYSRPSDLADNDVIFGRARRAFQRGPDGLFVDLGCGPGTAIGWHVAPTEAYYGIDVAPGMIEEARYRWPGWSFRVGTHLDVPRGTAYVLGGFGPIMYMHPLRLPELARHVIDALVPGGGFLLMGRPRSTPTRAIGDDLTYGTTRDQIEAAFDLRGVAELRVSGHRYALSRNVHQMSRNVQRFILMSERRLFPLQAGEPEYLVVEGRKA